MALACEARCVENRRYRFLGTLGDCLDWQAKLRTLIDVAGRGHPREDVVLGLTAGLDIHPGVTADQIDVLARRLPFALPQTLHDLYLVTDGVTLGNLSVFPLTRSWSHHTLLTWNEEFLPYLQDACETDAIYLIFGSDNGFSDLLCLTESGTVLRIYPRDPAVVTLVAPSLNSFLDEVCLGPGYLRYSAPYVDEIWVPVLREFGFLDGLADASAG